jgi:hypothetical protein
VFCDVFYRFDFVCVFIYLALFVFVCCTIVTCFISSRLMTGFGTVKCMYVYIRLVRTFSIQKDRVGVPCFDVSCTGRCCIHNFKRDNIYSCIYTCFSRLQSDDPNCASHLSYWVGTEIFSSK